MRNIVITGVSSGIGYGALKKFIEKDFRVFGSVRKEEDAQRLQKEFGENFIPLLFDVTDQKSISKNVKIVEAKIGNEGLAGLINNAGVANGGPLMHYPVESFRKDMEVLVVGQLAVTQAFLPLLGAKKNCPYPAGRIINISSVRGKIAHPFMGGYVAAKHALEGLSKSLRIELQLYGIDVIIVGAGKIDTLGWEKATQNVIENYKNTDYNKPLRVLERLLSKSLDKKRIISLEKFSQILYNIFETKNPKPRYVIVKNKFKNWIMPRLMPVRIMNKLIASKLNMKNINSSI